MDGNAEMTRDELLAKIDERTTYLGNSDGLYFALRAVVELHKPIQISNEQLCNACEEWTNEGQKQLFYPCPTIQAITNRLGE